MAATSYRSLKGMRDLLPPETVAWAAVEQTAREVFQRFGYGEIRTPLLEATELFIRSVGESSDVVGKQMYSFPDRKGRSLTLRPENTAAVVRAYLQHRLAEVRTPQRLYYVGPQFRYERPQKGRYRQFSQIGAELIGSGEPLADVELLLLLTHLLQALGFRDLTVLLNSVGDAASRASYREVLLGHLRPYRDRLSPDSQQRLETNPLRILDSKAPEDRELLAAAPRLEDHLSAGSREHLRQVRSGLDALGIVHRLEPRLVRGLDYYTETVFEIVHAGLGAQDAIVGGGRYDGLIESFGGPPTPAIGFAIGLDRLLEALPDDAPARAAAVKPCLILAVGEVTPLQALQLAEELRREGIPAVSALIKRSLSRALRRADPVAQQKLMVVLLGDEELAADEVTVRDMDSGEQKRIARSELADELRARLKP